MITPSRRSLLLLNDLHRAPTPTAGALGSSPARLQGIRGRPLRTAATSAAPRTIARTLRPRSTRAPRSRAAPAGRTRVLPDDCGHHGHVHGVAHVPVPTTHHQQLGRGDRRRRPEPLHDEAGERLHVSTRMVEQHYAGRLDRADKEIAEALGARHGAARLRHAEGSASGPGESS